MSKYESINPYTNETFASFSNPTEDQIEDALNLADALYHKWQHESPQTRATQLEAISAGLAAHKEALAMMMTNEMGKLLSEAREEVDICVEICHYYAVNGPKLLEPTPLPTSLGHAYYLKQATGVILACEPWNFPLYQIIRVFAPNFVVGNPMILKHAHNVPSSAALTAKIIKQAGAPEGSLINLYLSYSQLEQVMADKRVQGVALTGSERGGTSVAQEAGKNLKKSTMELGGNDAFIVLDDADTTVLENVLADARTYNAGQVCTSSKRMIVVESQYEHVLKILKQVFSHLVAGNPAAAVTSLAPLNSQEATDKAIKQVKSATEAGAKVYYQYPEIKHPGAFFRPTILTNIAADNPMFDTEIFAPVAEVFCVKDEYEAIKLANQSNYGLGSSVISADIKHAETVAAKIETGMTVINGRWITAGEIPFGGVKRSGYGRELSPLGLMAFVNEHLVIDVTDQNR